MDPIANMLVSIRNAQAVQKEAVDIPYSRTKHSIAELLVKQGFLSSVEKKGKKAKKPTLFIVLRYRKEDPKKGVISALKRISKPGRRMYMKKTDIQKVRQGYGVGIISTSQGIMTTDEAHKKGLGGEIMCEVW